MTYDNIWELLESKYLGLTVAGGGGGGGVERAGHIHVRKLHLALKNGKDSKNGKVEFLTESSFLKKSQSFLLMCPC